MRRQSALVLRDSRRVRAASLLAQDRQRASAASRGRRTVRAALRQIETVVRIRPVAEHAKRLDVTVDIEFGALRRAGRCRKCAFAERLLARDQEERVVRHQARHRRDVAGSARREPSVDPLANRTLVIARLVRSFGVTRSIPLRAPHVMHIALPYTIRGAQRERIPFAHAAFARCFTVLKE
ncbi:hypothetical protein [Burkholderia sp. ABCPW 14]|uniref:hypothetical protein n=1 Tax=Burkholderia sp. ABCPW 14 TaxID=1637860 RepID=UPI0012E34671